MADEEFFDPGAWAESYRLVGCRNKNQIRRVREQLAGTYIGAGSFHGEALAQHGLPPDFWLPFKLAIKWRSNDFPASATDESIQHWEQLQHEVVGAARLGSFREGQAAEMLADWEHDRALIAKFAPELVDGQETVAHAPAETSEESETAEVPKSLDELLVWCQRQLLWLEDQISNGHLGPAYQDRACHRLGRSALRFAKSFSTPELCKKLHQPPMEPSFLTRGQASHNLTTLAAWCEAELRHREARGLLDASQPRSPIEFKGWCEDCLRILRQQPLDEASYLAREAVGLAALFCAGLALPNLQAICVTVYPMPPQRAIRIMEACSLACEREELRAKAAADKSPVVDAHTALDQTSMADPLDSQPVRNDPEESAPRPRSREQKFEWLAKAMLLVNQHPDWPDCRIAVKVGRNKSALSRCKEYREAARIVRAKENNIRKGRKTLDEHRRADVEAVVDAPTKDRGAPIPGSKYFREYCAECDEPIGIPLNQVGKSPLCDRCRTR